MRVFKFFDKYKLDKDNPYISNKIVNISQNNCINYESGNISQLDIDGILDTEDELTIAKYKNNIRLLVDKIKEEGSISNFKIIRDDDFFPTDYMWTLSSHNTNIELGTSMLTYELRMDYARSKSNKVNNGISIPSKTFDEELKNLDKNYGKFFIPVAFRSTKHFTINTPLGYTHDYNNVESNRKFTIIDDIDNFINSGYAYTMSYKDAYLDISHEPLLISRNAIVLISQDNYNELSKNQDFVNQINNLDGRKLIIYTGDESIAINMVLSQIGVLPSRMEHKTYEYDPIINNILEQSMIDLCSENSIDYNLSHGNNHFSSIFDDRYNINYNQGIDFYNYLKQQLPNIEFDERILYNSTSANEFIKLVGNDKIIDLINKYNILMPVVIKDRYKNYIEDRNTITPSISNLFKVTINLIKEYYKFPNLNITVDENNKIEKLFCMFFQCESVSQQVECANSICNVLGYNSFDFDMENSKDLKSM